MKNNPFSSTIQALQSLGRGTYVLVLHLAANQQLQVGKLGKVTFDAGFYAYVGSAFGSGGLLGRLKHHLRTTDRPHWHIDYLRQSAPLTDIWLLDAPTPREHDWAALLHTMPGARLAVPRFGASDCTCAGHLFYFREAPLFGDFQALANQAFPADTPLQRIPMR